MPWHGLGVVLDEDPRSIDEALEKAGLGWRVTDGDVLVVKAPEWTDDFGAKHPPELVPAKGVQGQPARGHREVLGSSPTDTRWPTTATPSASSTR
jgi:hypothetical protein